MYGLKKQQPKKKSPMSSDVISMPPTGYPVQKKEKSYKKIPTSARASSRHE